MFYPHRFPPTQAANPNHIESVHNMSKGKIKFYDDERGFGFIEVEASNDLFFHVSEIKDGYPTTGATCTYELDQSRRGPCAVNVCVL
jgi:CspA family cold shock protein